MYTTPISYIQKITTAILLLATMVFSAGQFIQPPTVEAAGVPLDAERNQLLRQSLVQQTAEAASGGVTATGVTSLSVKETVLDPIAYQLAKVFLRQTVTAIVNWINSGFQGNPAFVTDLGGFLSDVADEAVGNLIYNDPALNFLCSPFQLDVKIALAIQYADSKTENYQPQCTLSDVAGNVEGFLDGAFQEGGWEGWFHLTQNPENNPLGAYYSAQTEAYARIVNEQGEEIAKLDFGDGFFSMEICDIAEQRSGARPNCTIGTPGSVIADQINRALGAGQDELIAADEINEIFNALFAQLAKQAITGVYGLLGLGGGSSSYTDYSFGSTNSETYLDAIIASDASTTIDVGLTENSSPMTQPLAAEFAHLELQTEIIGRVDAAAASYESTRSELLTQGCSVTFDFPDELETARDDAETAVEQSLLILELLQALQEQFTEADSITQQTEALEDFNDLQSQGILRTSTDNVQTQLFIEYDLALDIFALEEDLTEAENDCE